MNRTLSSRRANLQCKTRSWRLFLLACIQQLLGWSKTDMHGAASTVASSYFKLLYSVEGGSTRHSRRARHVVHSWICKQSMESFTKTDWKDRDTDTVALNRVDDVHSKSGQIASSLHDADNPKSIFIATHISGIAFASRVEGNLASTTVRILSTRDAQQR